MNPLQLRLGLVARLIKLELAKCIWNFNSYTVAEYIEKKIKSYGYLPAFPTLVCGPYEGIHFTPEEPKELEEWVKIDFGITSEGLIVDNCITFMREPHSLLKDTLKFFQTLDIKKFTYVHNINNYIVEYFGNLPYYVSPQIEGHTILKDKLHSKPFFGYSRNKQYISLKEGQIFTIEPLIMERPGYIYEGKTSVYENKGYSCKRWGCDKGIPHPGIHTSERSIQIEHTYQYYKGNLLRLT